MLSIPPPTTASSSTCNHRTDAAVVALRKKLESNVTQWMGRFHESLMESLQFVSFDDDSNRSISNSSSSATTAPSLVLSFVVTKNLCNDFDTLHGGAQAAATDVFTSLLLDLVHPVPSVTTDLHVSCVSAAPLGSKVFCHCRAEKYGGSIQYSSCDLYREVAISETIKGGEHPASQLKPKRVLVAKGLHTKYVVKKRTKGYEEAAEVHRRSKL